MGDLCVAVIVGRLTRDAELKYTSTGQAVSHFSVATGSRVKKGDQWVDESSFWEVDLWGKRAESLNQYLTKGKLVGIQGDMRQDKWEQDGQSRMKVKITANDVQLLGSSGASGSPTPAGSGTPGLAERSPAKTYPEPSQNGGQSKYPGAQKPPLPARNFPNQGGAAANDDFTDDIPF
jgi:single-strand DNA-binding protein